MTRPPQEVEQYGRAVADRLHQHLRHDLLAVYLGGSAALSDFDPATSDIDVLAVCRDGVSRLRRTALVPDLSHDRLPCPARGLELVLYPESVARQPHRGAGFLLELNDGPAMSFRAAVDPGERPTTDGDFWYVLDRSIVAAHGRTLLGPPPSELLVAGDDLLILDALRASVAWHRDDPGRDAVLNACRGLRWAEERAWSSKRRAGRWWLTRQAEPVVRAALDGAIPRPRDARAFLDRASAALRAAT